jgi:sulfate adenylyltransferase
MMPEGVLMVFKQRAHGGRLIDQTMDSDERDRFLGEASDLPTLEVDGNVAQDLCNIAHGVYSPLEGFMGRDDFESVLANNRTARDVVWTIPIVLDLFDDQLPDLAPGSTVALIYKGRPMASLKVEDVYTYDKDAFVTTVFGTDDPSHPGVAKVLAMGDRLVGGPIRLADDLVSPFPEYTLWPIETRVLFREKGWQTVVAFQTRNPPHLGHEYVQKSALTFTDGLFVNPIIGKKKVGDFTDDVIIRTYQELIDNYYLRDRAVMGILQSEMRYGGPKEAILHAIMRKNFGCTHFIVGRDHAGVGDFYSPFAAQEIFFEFPDLGITPMFFKSFFYCKKCGSIANEKICPHEGDEIINFSGSKIRGRLVDGLPPGEDMMRPEVSKIILDAQTPFVE